MPDVSASGSAASTKATAGTETATGSAAAARSVPAARRGSAATAGRRRVGLATAATAAATFATAAAETAAAAKAPAASAAGRVLNEPHRCMHGRSHVSGVVTRVSWVNVDVGRHGVNGVRARHSTGERRRRGAQQTARTGKTHAQRGGSGALLRIRERRQSVDLASRQAVRLPYLVRVLPCVLGELGVNRHAGDYIAKRHCRSPSGVSASDSLAPSLAGD